MGYKMRVRMVVNKGLMGGRRTEERQDAGSAAGGSVRGGV